MQEMHGNMLVCSRAVGLEVSGRNLLRKVVGGSGGVSVNGTSLGAEIN